MSSWAFRTKGVILRAGLRLLSATWRMREEIPDDCRAIIDGRERGIIAFWHGKMFPVWYRFRRRNASALISGSRDGELLAGYLARSLGYHEVIRGSSSKGGSRALAEMIDVLSRRTLLITPDGPRGPAREGKPGVLIAAARTALPVILAGWSCRRRITLNSWDSMEIPYPFSTIIFRYCIFDFSLHGENRRENIGREEGEIRVGEEVQGDGEIRDGELVQIGKEMREDEEAREDEENERADEYVGTGKRTQPPDQERVEKLAQAKEDMRSDEREPDATRVWIDGSLLQRFSGALSTISYTDDD